MITENIRKDIKKSFKKLNLELNENYTVNVPVNTEHGDYSSNACLVSAKLNSKSPRDIATQVVELLKEYDHFEDVSVAGPGFINFKLDRAIFITELIGMRKAGREFGSSKHGKKEEVLIEFISANPTGPLNIVSARAAAYGDSLYRIMNKVGYLATREFYINDAGNQVDILAESLELRYREALGEVIGEFPLEAYHGAYLVDLAKELVDLEGSKLLHFSEKDRLRKIEEFALARIHEMQVESLKRYEVFFDSWISEQAIRKQGILEEALSYLAEAGCTYEKDEAVWFASTKFGDEKDRVLIKMDGNVTYLVPDIAYHLTKYQRGYEHIIDVLGPDHHGYVPRLMAAMEALGFKGRPIEIIYLQQVNLYNEGERMMMSKREGKIITMDEVVEEVGLDAARFFFVDRKPAAHLNFDLELALKQSSDNPVFYIQYAHARIAQISKKAKKEMKLRLERLRQSSLRALETEEEFNLIKKAMDFPQILIAVSKHREPHRLSGYLYELASLVHKYYHNNVVINLDSKELTEARLYLLLVIKDIIAEGLSLIGVTSPEKM